MSDRQEILADSDYRLATFTKDGAVVLEIAVTSEHNLLLLGLSPQQARAVGENLIARSDAAQGNGNKMVDEGGPA